MRHPVQVGAGNLASAHSLYLASESPPPSDGVVHFTAHFLPTFYRRVEVDLLVQFLPGGEMEAKVDSPFVDMTVTPGRWSVGTAEARNRRRRPTSLGERSAVYVAMMAKPFRRF